MTSDASHTNTRIYRKSTVLCDVKSNLRAFPRLTETEISTQFGGIIWDLKRRTLTSTALRYILFSHAHKRGPIAGVVFRVFLKVLKLQPGETFVTERQDWGMTCGMSYMSHGHNNTTTTTSSPPPSPTLLQASHCPNPTGATLLLTAQNTTSRVVTSPVGQQRAGPCNSLLACQLPRYIEVETGSAGDTF